MSLIDTFAPDRLAAARLSSTNSQDSGALREMINAYSEGSRGPLWHSDWAWTHYEPLALALARRFGLRRLLEIGGGRDPGFLYLRHEPGLDIIINDIDQAELALLPPGTPTAQFDIAGDLAGRHDLFENFDMLTARMVFEHIQDVRAAWQNVHRLLRPGGIGMAFFPTLYALPFAINAMLPAQTAKRIVELVYPSRSASGDNPVFPARYDWCFGSEAKQRQMLEPIGFSEIVVLPFWGHHYLDGVPVLRTIDNAFNRACAALNWRLFTTYAVILAMK
ncbi:AdoMet_MTases domain containing protein [Rhabdaerophilaceae bacterium]